MGITIDEVKDSGTITEIIKRLSKLETDVSGILTSGNKFGSTRVLSAADQSIPNSTWTPLTFDTEVFDQLEAWVVGSPSRLTVKVKGVYLITGLVSFASNATGVRAVGIRKGGTTFYSIVNGNANSGGDWSDRETTTILDLNATEYVEIMAYQNSGGALNSDGQSPFAPLGMIHRLS